MKINAGEKKNSPCLEMRVNKGPPSNNQCLKNSIFWITRRGGYLSNYGKLFSVGSSKLSEEIHAA